MIFCNKFMQHFIRTRPSASLRIFGAALMAIWGLRIWRLALAGQREVKAARARNKEACDSFIRKHGLPDCRSIVWAVNGVARRGSRNQYWERITHEVLSTRLKARILETYTVPDDIDGQDGAMCRRWLAAHAELHEGRPAGSATRLSRPKHGAWQPPPTHVLLGCSTKRNEKLWRECLGKIEANVASEEDQQSRENMVACLEWVRLYGYPSTGYSLVWAACGIATCTTLAEFSRFWATHGQSPERQDVYAVGVVRAHEEVVCWRYGLAAANLGPPPLREDEETWSQYLVR